MQAAMIFKPFSYSYQNVPTSINPIFSSSLLISLSLHQTPTSLIFSNQKLNQRNFIAKCIYTREEYTVKETPIELSTHFMTQIPYFFIFLFASSIITLFFNSFFSGYPTFPSVMNINHICEILPHRLVILRLYCVVVHLFITWYLTFSL